MMWEFVGALAILIWGGYLRFVQSENDYTLRTLKDDLMIERNRRHADLEGERRLRKDQVATLRQRIRNLEKRYHDAKRVAEPES